MYSDDDAVLRGPHERGVWSKDEHDKFLAAVARHPHGPWKTIAALVGTRSVRQVQTHAQKYHEKVTRRERGLQKNRQKVARLEHRVDDAAYDFLQRPRGGKGQKRGKYNKRNRDVRVAPIPPRPRVALPIAPPTRVGSESVSPESRSSDITPAPSVSPRSEEIQPDHTPSRLPPVICGDDLLEETLETMMPLPSPNEVGSPDLFRTAQALHSKSPNLLLDDDLFSLTVDSDIDFADARAATPLLLDGMSASAPLTSETIDSMLYDDIVAVEEAPEHALSIGDVPSLNDALDYFLKVMTVWGPGTGIPPTSPGNAGHR